MLANIDACSTLSLSYVVLKKCTLNRSLSVVLCQASPFVPLLQTLLDRDHHKKSCLLLFWGVGKNHFSLSLVWMTLHYESKEGRDLVSTTFTPGLQTTSDGVRVKDSKKAIAAEFSS